MIIRSALFIGSSATVKQCPPPGRPEFAFIGRSNVGKSSLINLLTGNSKLAKTSGNPGKTRTINHFLINDEWYLVDLPGYGYAKVSAGMREKWVKASEDYILKRENLLSNVGFVSKAPVQLVNDEKRKLEEEKKLLSTLE